MHKRIVLNFLFIISFYLVGNAQDQKEVNCSRSKVLYNSANFDPANIADRQDFDVEYYKIDLDINPGGKTVSGTVFIKSRIINNTNTITLDLISSFFVKSIKSNGKSLSFNQSKDELTIILDKTYFTGELSNLSIEYSGTPGPTFHFDTNNGMPWIWTLSQPYGSKDWWPCKNLPDDKADSVRLNITVPSDLIVASNGKLLSAIEKDGKTTYTWLESYPIVSYLVSLAIHPYKTVNQHFKYSPSDSMPVIHYITPTNFDNNKESYKITTEMLKAFSSMFGLYPFIEEKYGHAEFPWSGGMEHQTISSMLGPYEFLIAHELAHQWWGDMITCRDFHHIWLNEGFATYSEALWQEYKSGKEALHNTMKGKIFLGRGKIYVDNIEEQGRIFNHGLSYNKAAWVLHMLRNVVGDDLFFQILKAWGNSDKRFGTAVTEDFKAVCENVADQDLDYFFDQWIYGDFHPVYLYDWHYNQGNFMYRTELNLSQFQTGGIYKMPVDVTILTVAGEEKFRVFNDSQNQLFEFYTESEPVDLIIDKDNWILKEIRKGIKIANHDNNSMTFSVTNDGSLGFENPDGFGNGLIYPESGKNNLFFGSFMIGNNKDYVADNSEYQPRKDFKNLGQFNKADEFAGAQFIKTTYSDELHPIPKGITIEQRSYSDPVYPNREFIIIDYLVKNQGTETLPGIYPSLFLDLDIGDYLDNQIKKDEANKLIWQYNDGIYIGIKLLSQQAEKINFSGIVNAIDELSENKKYDFLSGKLNQYQAEKKADWSSLLSTGPFDLEPGDSIKISFAVCGGTSEQKLKSNAANAQNYYNTHLVNTKERELDEMGYKVYPNPACDHINISFEKNSGCQIELTDVLNRTIKHRKCLAQTKEVTFNTSDLNPGIYFIIIKNEERTTAFKVVLE
ncbi:MAG: M1 family aminopeptidase [Deltaproteobacteria bacterium]